MIYRKAKWTNGKKIISGEWVYCWAKDCFFILLDSKDNITGQNRKIITYLDLPQWGKWKLVEDKVNAN